MSLLGQKAEEGKSLDEQAGSCDVLRDVLCDVLRDCTASSSQSRGASLLGTGRRHFP